MTSERRVDLEPSRELWLGPRPPTEGELAYVRLIREALTSQAADLRARNSHDPAVLARIASLEATDADLARRYGP